MSGLDNFVGIGSNNSRKEDQLKAILLGNKNIFRLWNYYKLAERIYNQVLSGETIWEILNPTAPIATGPYRPPVWNNLPTDLSQLVLVKTNIGGYFFDGILREDHTSSLKITQHPVQTGAAITDHSFVEPARVSLDVFMSDAMDSLVPNQFTGRYTKSVSGYQALQDLQESRIPVSVHTRIRDYNNMLIERIEVPDDRKTQYGLHCTVDMREIFVVDVAQTTVSARSQATGSTNSGEKQAETPQDNGTVLSQVEEKAGVS